MDFLAEKNGCGNTILRIVSRGNAIIAELLRLSEFIPPVFRMTAPADKVKYANIILDFSYFKSSEFYDNKIDTSPELQDLDEEFRENHMDILRRFYKAFESVLKYIQDLNRFLEDLEEGVFIQQTVDTVLQNEDGKQLLAEGLYLYGVILLIIDTRIEGSVRERLLVSFHRYAMSEVEQANVDEVCKLLRSTGFSPAPGAKRPPKYPEEYFARLAPPSHFVTMLIGRLSSDDIYNQVARYPFPEHRSTALATQASMLYVLLYFSPQFLNNEQAKMREIVDKHFPDNWVLTVYMGVTVDLCDAWEPYKAGRTALNNTLEAENVKMHAFKHISRVEKLDTTILNLLKEGVLHREYVLDNIIKLLHTLREANVTIRWLMLHTHTNPHLELNKRCKAIHDGIVLAGYSPKALFSLLINTAQYEFVLKELFRTMLAEKQSRWDELRREGSDRMQELSDVFGGKTPLTRVEKNEKLQEYFANIGKQIAQLDFTDSTSAGRKIMQLTQALEEVEEFHQLANSLQIRQFLAETRVSLKHMLRTINIQEDYLTTIQIVADVSYAWEIIDNYTAFMQEGIKRDPFIVTKLRATFLKLASALELPLVRIGQAMSPDFASVSQHYSSELVAYVRKVLQIIPESMFEILHRIIDMQTSRVKEVPTRLDKDLLKEFAQLDERAEVSRLTHAISVFTEGILMMKATLVGVVKVDPKKLLEDGIRKEFVRQVADVLDKIIVFPKLPAGKGSELVPRLATLAARMSGFRRSFEYIQDYVTIYGLKIWQEEVSRIVNYNVEQECNSFLRTKVFDWQSVYQSKTIPIPRFPPVDQSVNFVGRLAREILALTDPRSTTYIEQMCSWYDNKTQREVLNGKICTQLQAAVGSFGLFGLDRFLSFVIVKELQNFQVLYRNAIHQDKSMLQLHAELKKALGPLASTPPNLRAYAVGVQKGGKLWGTYAEIVCKVGQIQLIRRQIAHELHVSSTFDSKFLASALDTFNQALLTDVQAHYADPTLPYPSDDSPLMSEVSSYLDCAGLNTPLTKIYVTTKKLDSLSINIFFFVISQLPKLAYSKAVSSLLCKKPGEPLDGPAFVVGLITLLKQFHSTHTHRFLAYMGQYIRANIEAAGAEPKTFTELPAEVVTALQFVDEFCEFSQVHRSVATIHIPSYLFDEFKSHAA